MKFPNEIWSPNQKEEKGLGDPNYAGMDRVSEELMKLGVTNWWMVAKNRVVEESPLGSRGRN